MTQSKLTVGLIPLQGTLGLVAGRLEHFSEYPMDAGVYLRHLGWWPRATTDIAPDIAVPTGGFSRKETPNVSEAESSMMFCESSGEWPGVPVVLDDIALDSGENVLTGLMTARLAIDGLLAPVADHASGEQLQAAKASSVSGTGSKRIGPPIGRVVIFPAWRFKALRFTLTAEALGLTDYEIRGYAEAKEAVASERAAWGEAATGVAAMVRTEDVLLLGEDGERKRQGRFAREGYDRRLSGLELNFPRTFAALAGVRSSLGKGKPDLSELRQAFREEVLR